MANDVINPYQTFRDDDGAVLSGGSLKIYVNRTNEIGTAFADSELQVPQSVDPYRLDNAGRVTGDLRWSGERTVEVYDSDDALVRTLNDVVTLVDTSGFAINFASVAAMAADANLEAGDVCETQSYNADQNEGGARYIVTATSLTVDNYRVIDLTPTGLQAQLLDQEKNKNFYVAGAIGNGIADDSQPVQRLLDIGGNIECADGTFRATGLTLSVTARLHGNGVLKHEQFTTQDLLTISGSNLFLWFDGVTLDGDSDNQLTEGTVDLISSTLSATTGNESLVSFSSCTFQDPTLYAIAADGADDGQTILYSFASCLFLGGQQATATPFTPAYVQLTDGVNAQFDDCYFDLEEAPTATGGRGGIITSNAAFTNPGYLSVSDCTFNRIGAASDAASSIAAIDAQGVKDLMITDNRFISPQVGAIVWGAEVDSVKVNGNLIDGLTGDVKVAAIASEVTTQTTPGNNWQIQNNQLVSIAGIAMLLDGASAGVDVADVSIVANLIDSPTSQAILLENINGVDIRANYINMESVASVNGIQVDADGLSGTVVIEGNTIINVNGNAIDAATTSSAVLEVSRNVIEGVAAGVGINVDAFTTVLVTNNAMDSVATTLIALGAAITTALVDGNSYTGTAPTTYVSDAGVTTLTYGDNFLVDIDSSIVEKASATSIEATAHYHEVTGTTTINTITFPANVLGWELTLVGSDANSRTVSDGVGNLALAGNFALGQDDTLTLAWNGSGWDEVARSTN